MIKTREVLFRIFARIQSLSSKFHFSRAISRQVLQGYNYIFKVVEFVFLKHDIQTTNGPDFPKNCAKRRLHPYLDIIFGVLFLTYRQ